MSNKLPSYIASLILSVKWHKLLGTKKEDIVHYRAKLIRLENEGLTLFWNHHDKDFSAIYVEKGDYTLDAEGTSIVIQDHKVHEPTEVAEGRHWKFQIYPINALIDFNVHISVELSKYNQKISKSIPDISLEGFKKFVADNYKEHWLFNKDGLDRFGETDYSFRTFQECDFQVTDYGIALEHEFIAINFAHVQLSDKPLRSNFFS